jgi:tRNA(Arg) A34 adenosine deaminase TadA
LFLLTIPEGDLLLQLPLLFCLSFLQGTCCFANEATMPHNDPQPLTGQEIAYLRQAIELAAQARAHGAHPFGSLIVDANGQILVTARNNAVPPKGDPTQHAERLACSLVGRQFTPAQLAHATLYTSTEPCVMCAGAIYWTGIGRVVYALSETSLYALIASQQENPAAEILALPSREVFARGQRQTVVQGPFLEEEAAQVHQNFWIR